MRTKPTDTAYQQGLHRWEPWQVVAVAFIAGAATMGIVVVLLGH